MKKIPTIFVRDWNGDRSRVLPEPNPDCAWVFDGEGVATRKLDGTSCMVMRNHLFKRREFKEGTLLPTDLRLEDIDAETGKIIGWVPVTDAPEDRYHREAWTGCDTWRDGTYELIGPKVQGNAESQRFHLLIRHGGGPAGRLEGVPRTYDGLKDYLATHDIEGIVFHHPDGRMAKIKGRDFGHRRGAKQCDPK